MMLVLKQTFFIFFVAFSITLIAQIPAGYYDSATGLTGSNLKTALYNIIKNPNVDLYDNLWTDFEQTDKKSDGSVWDIYSNYIFYFTSDQCGNYSAEGDCFNREHSFPKSWFNDAAPMYSDLFHIYPSDGYVNGQRSNLPYGKVGTATYTSTNGSKKGNNVYGNYSGTVFEPADEFKGDLARTYFYMVTCYENLVASWETNTTEADAVLNGTTFPAFEDWSLQMLMEWNDQDPVDQKEIDRNNAIYNIQGNRNPFIDHPEFVCLIWGNNCPNDLSFQNTNHRKISFTAKTYGIEINGYFTKSNMADVQIFNPIGQVLYQSHVTISSGNWTYTIPLSSSIDNTLLFVALTVDDEQSYTGQILFLGK